MLINEKMKPVGVVPAARCIVAVLVAEVAVNVVIADIVLSFTCFPFPLLLF